MDVKIEPCSFSLYEQMRRLPDGTITLANTEYTRNYIRECEAALCFKDRYCKGEIVCLGIEEEDKEILLKKMYVKTKELQSIIRKLEELEERKK